MLVKCICLIPYAAKYVRDQDFALGLHQEIDDYVNAKIIVRFEPGMPNLWLAGRHYQAREFAMAFLKVGLSHISV